MAHKLPDKGNPCEVRLCQGAIKVAEATIVAITDPMVNSHRVA